MDVDQSPTAAPLPPASPVFRPPVMIGDPNDRRAQVRAIIADQDEEIRRLRMQVEEAQALIDQQQEEATATRSAHKAYMERTQREVESLQRQNTQFEEEVAEMLTVKRAVAVTVSQDVERERETASAVQQTVAWLVSEATMRARFMKALK
ncbi:hypothetical protein KIPB_003425 [Kipferlia bialata]|uniref:Uncharacterized protein n=1 Tax=Kipferlia bialata TaxID=797122 RepID=A0A9K3CTN4_9EUKA|nr:hypothetical protein KIPB_003425 [Kipferlia bialata]|eukprot:g3425.t1